MTKQLCNNLIQSVAVSFIVRSFRFEF